MKDKEIKIVQKVGSFGNCMDMDLAVKSCNELAKWKDAEFINLLYKWMYEGKIEVRNIEELIKEIIL